MVLKTTKDYYLILNIHLNVNYCAYYINFDIPNEGPYIVGELKNRDLVHFECFTLVFVFWEKC